MLTKSIFIMAFFFIKPVKLKAIKIKSDRQPVSQSATLPAKRQFYHLTNPVNQSAYDSYQHSSFQPSNHTVIHQNNQPATHSFIHPSSNRDNQLFNRPYSQPATLPPIHPSSQESISPANQSIINPAKYKQIEDFQLCSNFWTDITNERECQGAAAELNLEWGNSWNGPEDFPGCLFAHDGRNQVFFNNSPSPSKIPNNPKYAAICKARTTGIHNGQDGVLEQADAITSKDYGIISGDEKYRREHDEVTSRGNGVASGYETSVAEYMAMESEKFKKMNDFQLCSDSWTDITNERECQAAAAELNLEWGNSWNGPEDFPGCLFAHDGRNQVFFNTSPSPSKISNNQKYAAICKNRARGIHSGQDRVLEQEDDITSNDYSMISGDEEYRREHDEVTSRAKYKKMHDFQLCSDSWTDITNERECQAAAAELNLEWGNIWNGPEDFPGCLFAHDGRNQVFFNTSPSPSKIPNNQKYAAICKKRARGIHNKQDGIMSQKDYGVAPGHDRFITKYNETESDNDKFTSENYDEVVSGDDEVLSGDDEYMSGKDKVISEDDEIMSGDDEVISGDVGVMSGDGEVISGDNENLSQESGDSSGGNKTFIHPPSARVSAYLKELKSDDAIRDEDGQCLINCIGPRKALLHHTNPAVAGYNGSTSENGEAASDYDGDLSVYAGVTSGDDGVASGDNVVASGDEEVTSGDDGVTSGDNGVVSGDKGVGSGGNLTASRDVLEDDKNNGSTSGDDEIDVEASGQVDDGVTSGDDGSVSGDDGVASGDNEIEIEASVQEDGLDTLMGKVKEKVKTAME